MMSRGPLPAHFGAGNHDIGGNLGAYVPADQYLRGSGSQAWGHTASSRPLQAACNNQSQALGPCAAGFGLDSDQLFPTSLDPCDGFDQVLVSAPQDFLYADSLLMSDVTTLTNNRNQSYDLRGDVPIAPIYSLDNSGQVQAGPFGGMYQSSIGAYELRAPVRTYLSHG